MTLQPAVRLGEFDFNMYKTCLNRCNLAASQTRNKLMQLNVCSYLFIHVFRLCVCMFVCVAGAVEVRKEGLETQINRLAELIGRLENKV